MSARLRCGTIALAGRPNTGKSTLLNRLVGERLAIVSPKAQTSRHLVRGVLTTPDAQYVFVDAPGLQARRASGLHRTLNRRALEAAHGADVIACVLEAGIFGAGDRAVLDRLPRGARTVAVVNKVDRVKRAGELLPYLARLGTVGEFHAIVPVSALTGRNLPTLLKVLRDALPEAPALYPADQLTDRDERFFAAELLREQLFRALGDELPYSCEAVIDSFREEGRLRRIEATILVERDSQKGIVVGARGARLKSIAAAARKDMERLFGGRVYLGVWVRVRRGWTDDQRVLRTLGYS